MKLNKRKLLVILGILYPIMTHIAIVQDHIEIALLFLGLVTGIFFLNQLDHSENFWKNWTALVPGIGLIVLAIGIVFIDSARLVLYLPPIFILVFFLVNFAKTLLPGREALITKISRIVFQDDTPGIVPYTRQLTWVWTCSLAILLIETVALSIFAPIEVWSLFTNILNYVFVLLLFVLEFIYRIYRFGSRYSVLYCLKKLTQLPINQLFKS